MNRSRRNALVSAGIVAGALILAVVLVLLRPAPPVVPPPDRTPVVVTEAVVAVDGALRVTGSGTVRPRAQIDLTPLVGGRIVWVSPALVSGGRVRAEELLLRIEPADYENAVAQARAQVAQDEVALLQAEEEARIALREFEQFRDRQAAAGQPVPEATALTLREPQLAAARATLARSRAQLADTELALARTEVRAPFDGVIRSEVVDRGGFAAAGQPLTTLYSSDEVEVVVPLTDEAAALIPGLWDGGPSDAARGIPAEITVRFGAHRYAWTGRVDRAEAALDERSRTLDVVVRVPRPFEPGAPVDGAPSEGAPPLLVGQFVDVGIEGRAGDYLELSRRALRTGNEVWVVRDGTVHIVPVEVVQRTADRVVVRGALAGGDAVVTDGISLATEGMTVRLRSESGT